MDNLKVWKARKCQRLKGAVGRSFDHHHELYRHASLTAERLDQLHDEVTAITSWHDDADLRINRQRIPR